MATHTVFDEASAAALARARAEVAIHMITSLVV